MEKLIVTVFEVSALVENARFIVVTGVFCEFSLNTLLPSFAAPSVLSSNNLPSRISSNAICTSVSEEWAVISLVSEPNVIFAPLYAFSLVEVFNVSNSIEVSPEVYTVPTFTVNGLSCVSKMYASNTAVLLVDVFVNAPEL